MSINDIVISTSPFADIMTNNGKGMLSNLNNPIILKYGDYIKGGEDGISHLTATS